VPGGGQKTLALEAKLNSPALTHKATVNAGQSATYSICLLKYVNSPLIMQTEFEVDFENISPCKGWGKITSLNFKVNNKKNIRDTKILFLDSETTAWEVLNHKF
jgi:hypothetical protein